MDLAVRDLDAHHLGGAALALPVDAVAEAEDAEHVVVDLTRLVAGQHHLELRMSASISGSVPTGDTPVIPRKSSTPARDTPVTPRGAQGRLRVRVFGSCEYLVRRWER